MKKTFRKPVRISADPPPPLQRGLVAGLFLLGSVLLLEVPVELLFRGESCAIILAGDPCITSLTNFWEGAFVVLFTGIFGIGCLICGAVELFRTLKQIRENKPRHNPP